MGEGFPTPAHKATLEMSPRAQQAELEWLMSVFLVCVSFLFLASHLQFETKGSVK